MNLIVTKEIIEDTLTLIGLVETCEDLLAKQFDSLTKGVCNG